MRRCLSMLPVNRRRCSTGSRSFVESVSQFDAATIKFKALGHARIVSAYLSKRCLAYWIGI